MSNEAEHRPYSAVDDISTRATWPPAASAEVQELRELLYDMVVQACWVSGKEREGCGYDFDSGFIGAHAEALRHLCAVGVLEMVNDGYGRCVQAKERRIGDPPQQPSVDEEAKRTELIERGWKVINGPLYVGDNPHWVPPNSSRLYIGTERAWQAMKGLLKPEEG